MSSEPTAARVMFDRGTHIIGMPSDGHSIGDQIWFGEPRNLEAVVIDFVDTHHDGVLAPRLEVLPEFLPRRGWLDWKLGGEVGYSGYTTPLVGEPVA